MARKVKAAVQPVAVNPEKIVRGLTTVFQGFSVMFDGMAEQMQLMQDMTDQLSFPGAVPPVDTPKEAVKVEAATPTEADTTTENANLQTVDTDVEDAVPQSVDIANADDVPSEEDTPPWEEPRQQENTEPNTATKPKSAVKITQADITQVIVGKIKLNRSNNGKIGKLLGAYGVNLLSDLPAEKYEAFLNDLSQL